MENNTHETRIALLAIAEQLGSTFVSRDAAIRCMMIAHLTGEHYLFVGDPGTAKTALAKAFSQHITGARFFSTMLGSFSAPEKVFGPLDIAAFQAGRYETVTTGKLPEADFGFLDEYFKCNEGALNEMLTALNEREFEGKSIPLMTAGTATNWPELEQRSEITDALYDRILLRCVVEDVKTEDDTVALLKAIDEVANYSPNVTVSLDDLKAAIAEVKRVKISDPIRQLLHSVRSRLATRNVAGQSRPGIQISGRRMGKLQAALRAEAWLKGRDEVTLEDFDVLGWGLWVERGDIEQVEAVLSSLDAEAVRKIIDRIDEARNAHASLISRSYGAASLNTVVDKVKEAAKLSRVELDAPVFTAKGREQARAAMRELKACFMDLDERGRKLHTSRGRRSESE